MLHGGEAKTRVDGSSIFLASRNFCTQAFDVTGWTIAAQNCTINQMDVAGCYSTVSF